MKIDTLSIEILFDDLLDKYEPKNEDEVDEFEELLRDILENCCTDYKEQALEDFE
jgi:hypothetical protein